MSALLRSSGKASSEEFNNALAWLSTVHDREVAALEDRVGILHRQIDELTLNGAHTALQAGPANWSREQRFSAPCASPSKPTDIYVEVVDELDFSTNEGTEEAEVKNVEKAIQQYIESFEYECDQGDVLTERTENSAPESKNVAGEKSVSFEMDFEDPDEDPQEETMTMIVRGTAKWSRLVDGMLRAAATKRQYALREDWVKPETFLKKVEKQHGVELDLWVLQRGLLNPEKSKRKTVLPTVSTHITASDIDIGGRRFQMCILNPASSTRIAWLGMGMLLVAYDIVVLPLSAFPLPDSTVLLAMQWIGQFFWTIDIMVTFCTAIYVDGDLVTRYSAIAKNYARTWLPFDLLVVVPLWLVAFTNADSSAKSTSLVKYARMLRFMRLARVAKLEHYLNEALGNLNSSLLLLVVGMVKLIIVLLVVVHFIACLWYAVGSSGSGGWASEYKAKELFYQYLCACHWSFSQFQGTSDLLPTANSTTMERMVAVLTIMFSVVILSVFVSSLTNIIMQMQSLTSEARQLDTAVRLFLSSNDISWQLSLRVKKYVIWKQRLERKLGGSNQVLEVLPKGMQADLHEQVRGAQLCCHRLFWALKDAHPRMFRDVCFEALKQYAPAPGEVIFSMNENSSHMYFILEGDYRYVVPIDRGLKLGLCRDSSEAVNSWSAQMVGIPSRGQYGHNPHSTEARTRVLGKGRFLAEASLWTSWDHCGILLASKHSEHMGLSTEEFARKARSNPPAHCSLILYARSFMAGLNTYGKHFTDVIEPEELMPSERFSARSVESKKSVRSFTRSLTRKIEPREVDSDMGRNDNKVSRKRNNESLQSDWSVGEFRMSSESSRS